MKLASLLLILLSLISPSLSAIEISLGPKVKDRIIVIQTTTEGERNVEYVECLQDKTVEVWFTDADGTVFVDKMNLKGTRLMRPDIAKVEKLIAPRVVENVTVKVLREDGKEDKLNIAGWYVRVVAKEKKQDKVEDKKEDKKERVRLIYPEEKTYTVEWKNSSGVVLNDGRGTLLYINNDSKAEIVPIGSENDK